MSGFAKIAEAAGETVYPYYVITMGAETEAAAGNYHVYKADSAGSFAAFTTSADVEDTAYSTVSGAMSAVTAAVTTGSGSATLQFGLTGTDAGAAISDNGAGKVTVSDGKIYSAGGPAVNYTGEGTVTIERDKWDETDGTGTLIETGYTGAGSCALTDNFGPVKISGGTVIGSVCATQGAEISGGMIDGLNGPALNLSVAIYKISGGTITSANTAEGSMSSLEDGLYPGTVFVSDLGQANTKLNISGGTITNTASGCPAIFNLSSHGISSDSPYTSELYLSGTTPSISRDADIWTSSAIHASDGTATDLVYYIGNDVSVYYGGSITSGTTVAVDNVTADNNGLFSITNQGYYLFLNSLNSSDLIINKITGKWLDDASYYSTAWYDDAIAADPDETEFTVSTAADLAGLAYLVNSGNNFNGDTITLASNINIGAHEWVTIGTEDHPFDGTFNGNDKTITSLYIDENDSCQQGLFSYIVGGTVKNLTVSGSVKGQKTVGGIAGYALDAMIKNCVNSGVVYGSGRYVGGIVGYAYHTTVDSSETGCDFLSVGLFTCSSGNYTLVPGMSVDSIRDEVGWTFKHYSGLDAGTYYLVFVYTKDTASDSGSDRGYVRLAGTNELLTGNASAKLDQTGLSFGEMFRCKVTYADGVALVSDNITLSPSAGFYYNYDGAAEPYDSESISLGKTVTKPTGPTRSGYTFGGWYMDSAYKTAYDFTALVTGNVTLYAKWTSSGGHRSSGSLTEDCTITVSEISSDVFDTKNRSIFSAEANMENAFSQSVEVRITGNQSGSDGFKLIGANKKVYPFDIILSGCVYDPGLGDRSGDVLSEKQHHNRT